MEGIAMHTCIKNNILKLALFASSATFLSACEVPGPSREDIVAQYPSVDINSTRPENKEILCPFVRMLERSGAFDAFNITGAPFEVSPEVITDVAEEFGCGRAGCGSVAQQVADSQGANTDAVLIEELHLAEGIAHDCGLTFALGGTQVSDSVRQSTLNRLAELANPNGQVEFEDIETVKNEICASQGVAITAAGELESKLIFAYLGGIERGYIDYSDIELFLSATMPVTKTDSMINAALISRVR